jgi:hypothetical protein
MDKEAFPIPPMAPPPTPQPRRERIVQCEGFRCMAYQDDSGKWRSFFGDKELTGFISVPPD